MFAVQVLTIFLYSVLCISGTRGAPRYTINFEGDTNEVPYNNQNAQWLSFDEPISTNQYNIGPHNIQIRSPLIPTIDFLKTPSILIGKLKRHLGLGPKHPGCHDNSHHRYEDVQPHNFKFNRHNFDDSEGSHAEHGFQHDRNQFHKHGGHWNEFPHKDFPDRPFHPNHKPHHPSEEPNHQHFPSHASVDGEKGFTNSVDTTTPQIDIRFGRS